MTPEEVRAKLAEIEKMERRADKLRRLITVLLIAGAALQLIGAFIALYQYLHQ